MTSKGENGIFEENEFSPEGASKPLKGKDTMAHPSRPRARRHSICEKLILTIEVVSTEILERICKLINLRQKKFEY